MLALAQRAEARSPYEDDADATSAMAADERIHEEVVRGLAARGRNRLSGTFRAAVFGANDGLVSNLSLVLGVSASGIANQFVLLTGLAGLLAGALSMGAGEYVSVRSQRELLEASTPDPETHNVLPDLDIDANELALLYRARGMDPDVAEARANEVLARYSRPWDVLMQARLPSGSASTMKAPARPGSPRRAHRRRRRPPGHRRRGHLELIEILRRFIFGDVFDTGVHDDQTRELWALATIGDVALQPGPN